jgi:alpha-1,6-mannosyltransferase
VRPARAPTTTPLNALDQIQAPRRPPATIELPRDLSERVGRTVGLAALATILVAGTIIAVDSAQHFTSVVANSWKHYPIWVRGPFWYLPGSLLSGGTYSEATFAMTAGWMAAILCWRWIGLRMIVGTIVATHLIFLLTPPLASTDIWNYIGYGHLGALHGLSPYAHAPIAAKHDPSFQWVTWPHLKTPYGPLFTISTYVVAPLGMAGGLWTLKALLTAAALAVLYQTYRLSQRVGTPPVLALAIVGLSPAWLVWLVGGAHNDVLMMILVLGAVSLWLSGRDAPAAFLLVLAAGFKAPAFLMVPILLLAARDRRRALVGAAAGAAVLVAATAIAFHSLQPLFAFQEQSSYHTNRSVLGELFRLFNAGDVTQYAQWPANVVFLGGYLLLLRWVRRGADPLRAAGWAFAGLLAVTLWEFPWYMAWVFPFAAITVDRRLKIAAVAMTVLLLVAYVPPYLALT